jgi:hypothetical protein
MANRTDADFLQVLLREVREDPLVDLLSRNAASYSSRPRPRSQTTMSMTGAYNRGYTHHRPPAALELRNAALGLDRALAGFIGF